MYIEKGGFKPLKAPVFTKEERAKYRGTMVMYCPECGWWTKGASAKCCGPDLRFWEVD